MTATSQVPAAIDYLVNAAVNSPLLGESAAAPVVIHDGPPVTDDPLAQPRHLYIGWDQVSGSGGDDSVQSWPVEDHARTKDEDGTVTCTADAWSGSTVLKAARDSCAAIVAAVELLLRGDPAAGGPGDASMGGIAMWSGVDDLRWFPRQTPQGAGMACVFTVVFRARLTTS